MQITQNQKPMQKAANPQVPGDVINQESKSAPDQKNKFSNDLQSALKQAEVAAQSMIPTAGNPMPVEVKTNEKGAEPPLVSTPQAMVSDVTSQATAATASAAPAASGVSTGAAAKASKAALMAKANDSRIQANEATGTNAMSALAGLKPWSKDWVVGNEMSKSPELQTLFEGNQRGQADALAKSGGESLSQQDLLNLEQVLKKPTGLKEKAPSSANTETSLNQSSLDPWAALAAGASESRDPLSSLQGAGKNPAELASQAKQMSAEVKAQSAQSSQHPSNSQMASMTGAEFLNAFQMAQKPTVGEARTSLTPNVKGNDSKLGAAAESVSPLGASLASGSLKGSKKVNGLESRSLDDSQTFQQNPLLAGTNSQPAANAASAGIAATNLTAIVAKGTMSQDRLSSDTVSQMTQGIRSFGSNGKGEMRIHLKPDNLGELHLKVNTNGKEVGIEIQASSEQAKKVLEESLSSLKESLANQSLNLVKTEVAVGMGLGLKEVQAQLGQSSDFMNQPSQQNTSSLLSENSQRQFGNSQGQYSSGSQSGSSNGDRDLDRSAIAGWSGMTSSSGKPRAASGRLDVMA